MRKRMRNSLDKFCLTLLAVAILCQPAKATSGYYFNGGVRSILNKGAAAVIETQNPYVATNSSISSWVMTCDSSASTKYAQVGYIKFSNYSNPKYFYEYSYSPNDIWVQKVLGTAISGSHNEFMVGCDTHTMYFKINGIAYGTASLSLIPFSRNTVEILTETHNTSDQSPGSTSNPVSMGSAKYKASTDSWNSVLCYNCFGAAGTGYGYLMTQRNNILSTGATSWEVWDSRY